MPRKEQILTHEYTLTRNKIAISHVFVEKLKKNPNIFEMLQNFAHPFYVFL
jgi:hypothetical protein